MNDAEKNKQAWEYRVYEWRVQFQGSPEKVAHEIQKDPRSFLRCHADLFGDPKGKRVASICGSDGRRAVAMAALGAAPTVFDISEPQKKYALELANAAGVEIDYVIGDFCALDRNRYAGVFDHAYAEGGILHYFHDLQGFFETAYVILKEEGTFVLSDYHPFQKTCIAEKPTRNVEQTHGNYFDDQIHDGHVPYAKYFPQAEALAFPVCHLRFYTLSEIFNAAIDAGFVIERFWEHPKTANGKTPFEFTLVLKKAPA